MSIQLTTAGWIVNHTTIVPYIIDSIQLTTNTKNEETDIDKVNKEFIKKYPNFGVDLANELVAANRNIPTTVSSNDKRRK
jgi:hypothetical protein